MLHLLRFENAPGRQTGYNVLMFGDYAWDDRRTAAQRDRLEAWLIEVGPAPLVVVECGAGTAIPTVRHTCEALARATGATLIRINPREDVVPAGHVGLALGTLEAVRAIDRLL
jgi:hypothetical protein